MNSQLSLSPTTTTTTTDSSRQDGGAARSTRRTGVNALYRLIVKRECVTESIPRYCGCPLNSPDTVARIATTLLRDEDQECFLAFFLDAKNRILAYSEVARGAIACCPVDPRILFRAALLTAGCCSVIVSHCHPSNEPTPSREDNAITSKLVAAGAMLGIQVLDHIIVGGDTWHSYAAQGQMPRA